MASKEKQLALDAIVPGLKRKDRNLQSLIYQEDAEAVEIHYIGGDLETIDVTGKNAIQVTGDVILYLCQCRNI